MEVKKGRQVRLGGVLADLPSKTYRNAEELLNEIEAAEKMVKCAFFVVHAVACGNH